MTLKIIEILVAFESFEALKLSELSEFLVIEVFIVLEIIGFG